MVVVLLAFAVLKPLFGPEGTGPIFFSEKGPGAQHAPLYISLAVGLVVSWLEDTVRSHIVVVVVLLTSRMCARFQRFAFVY